MALNKREKVLLIILGGLILFYVYFTYFLSPVLQKVSSAKDNIASYELSLNSLNLTKLNNEKSKKQLEDIKSNIEDSQKALPKSERNPEINYNLKVMGDKSKITINSIDFGQVVSYTSQQENNKETDASQKSSFGDLNVVPVTANIQGDYKSILNFINAVEKDTRIAEVSSVNISNQDNSKASSLSATISISYYYLAEKSENSDDYDFNKGSYGKEDLFK